MCTFKLNQQVLSRTILIRAFDRTLWYRPQESVKKKKKDEQEVRHVYASFAPLHSPGPRRTKAHFGSTHAQQFEANIRQWCRDKTPSALYFKYNTQLGPPYQVIVDTNFINFSIRNKVRHLALPIFLCRPRGV